MISACMLATAAFTAQATIVNEYQAAKTQQTQKANKAKKGEKGGQMCDKCKNGHGPGAPMSLTSDEMVKKLNLTSAQVSKLKTMESNFDSKMKANRPEMKGCEQGAKGSKNAEKCNKDQKMKPGKGGPGDNGEMDKMMQEKETQIKGILSDSQYKTYQKMMQENRPSKPGDNNKKSNNTK